MITISALAYVPLAVVFQPWQWVRFGPFGFQPSFVLPYAVYFFTGLGVGAGGFARSLFRGRRKPGPAVACMAGRRFRCIPRVDHSNGAVVRRQGPGLLGLQVVADISFAASSTTRCFALVALFLRFAVRRPMLSNPSANAYGI